MGITSIVTTALFAMVFLGCDASKGYTDEKKESVNPPVSETTMLVDEELNVIKEAPSADTLLKSNKDLTFTVKGVSFTMKPVEGGSFWMGGQFDDPDGLNYSMGNLVFEGCEPVHRVVVSSFYIGETEVTQALWKAVMGKTVRQQRDDTDVSYYLRGEGKDYPMYYVSWEDCQEFVGKLNRLTGKEFRLPTEAEWEYAARGGKYTHGYPFAGNEEIDSVACYSEEHMYGIEAEEEVEMKESERPGTCPIKTLMPNELGLYDMSGNVGEWCSDWYDGVYYSNSPLNNPQGPDTGRFRVVRGGGWFDLAFGCCVYSRGIQESEERNSDTGLRLVLY